MKEHGLKELKIFTYFKKACYLQTLKIPTYDAIFVCVRVLSAMMHGNPFI